MTYEFAKYPDGTKCERFLMQNYYILDDGKTKLLKFKKLDEFKDKIELVVSLKAYNNGFQYEKE